MVPTIRATEGRQTLQTTAADHQRRAETVLMLHEKDMLRSARWCANSNLELLSQMSPEERGRYYGEMLQHKDALAVARPLMNRKHRILFDRTLGKRWWELKAGWMCRLERKKKS